MKQAFGGVVIDGGLVLLREPTNHFGGYVWTFPKGRPDAGETPEETALRETREETGVRAFITGRILGAFLGETTSTRFFVMRAVEITGRFDWETSRIVWVTYDEARALIGKTTSVTGRARDLEVLEAVRGRLL